MRIQQGRSNLQGGRITPRILTRPHELGLEGDFPIVFEAIFGFHDVPCLRESIMCVYYIYIINILYVLLYMLHYRFPGNHLSPFLDRITQA